MNEGSRRFAPAEGDRSHAAALSSVPSESSSVLVIDPCGEGCASWGVDEPASWGAADSPLRSSSRLPSSPLSCSWCDGLSASRTGPSDSSFASFPSRLSDAECSPTLEALGGSCPASSSPATLEELMGKRARRQSKGDVRDAEQRSFCGWRRSRGSSRWVSWGRSRTGEKRKHKKKHGAVNQATSTSSDRSRQLYSTANARIFAGDTFCRKRGGGGTTTLRVFYPAVTRTSGTREIVFPIQATRPHLAEESTANKT